MGFYLENYQRCHILAWTSLWIYLPFFIWGWLRLFEPEKYAPMYCAILLPLSGTVSIIHWKNNHTGDWRHCLDVCLAILLCIIFNFRIIIMGRYLVCFFISLLQLSFFISQRLEQRKRTICWKKVTILHLSFRYMGFWLAMIVHISHIHFSMFINLSMVLGLTLIYILHIKWLSLVKNII
jgi:hypothetical protein